MQASTTIAPGNVGLLQCSLLPRLIPLVEQGTPLAPESGATARSANTVTTSNTPQAASARNGDSANCVPPKVSSRCLTLATANTPVSTSQLHQLFPAVVLLLWTVTSLLRTVADQWHAGSVARVTFADRQSLTAGSKQAPIAASEVGQTVSTSMVTPQASPFLTFVLIYVSLLTFPSTGSNEHRVE